MKILVTGAAGSLASVVMRALAPQNEVVGVDVRPLSPGRELAGPFEHVRRYNQRRMADVFRKHRPDAMLHLGRARATQLSPRKRYDQNVLGTRNLLDLCVLNGVSRVAVLSTFHVYGAHQTNHNLIDEDEPLRAIQTFPEIADSVELDHAATTMLWRHPEVRTIVLRPANIIGPQLNNLMSRLLRLRLCPKLWGYDPLMQFLHETDAARAIVLALRSEQVGVYNVAGEGVVAWSRAIRLARSRPLALPHQLAYRAAGAFTQRHLPGHMVDYFRYPTVIADRRFREDLGFEPRCTTVETLESMTGQSLSS